MKVHTFIVTVPNTGRFETIAFCEHGAKMAVSEMYSIPVSNQWKIKRIKL